MRYSLTVLLCWFVLCLNAQTNLMEQRYKELRTVFTEREKTAQQDLKQYLHDYPYSIYTSEVEMMIGVLQTEKGRFKQAVKTFERVRWNELSRDDQPLLYFYRGYAYLQLNDMPAAIACFRMLKESENPYQMQGKYYTAYCQYRQKDYRHALTSFLELEQTPQYKHVVPYYIVQIYYAEHNYDETFTRAQELLKKNPNNTNNAELNRILGEIYYQRGDYAKTVEHIEQYRADYQEQKKELLREDIYLLAMAQYKQQAYADALVSFKQVKQMKDTLSQSACLHMGHAWRQLGDIEKAKLSYQAAMNITLSPTMREEAMYNYALTTYESSTALGESIKAFNDFLTEYPNTGHANEAYQLLASVYMSSKNYRAALDAVNAIPNQTTQVAQIRQYLQYQIGVDAFLQNKMGETVKWMTEVIKSVKPENEYRADAYYYRAEAEYRMQRYQDCLEDIETFINLPHNQSQNLLQADYLLGYTQFSMKQYGEAEDAFRRFVTTRPEQNLYCDAYNRIGDCSLNRRDFTEAIAAYQEVINQHSIGADYATFQTGAALGLQHKYADKALMMEQLVSAYPKSDYADDALYESARAYLQEKQNDKAIDAYKRLAALYPNSPLAKKVSLETAMTYRNMEQTELAIEAFRLTITRYPATEEAYAALDALEQIYVENNRLNEYIDFAKQIGKSNMKMSFEEDSLTYAAAEWQYMMGHYAEAAAGMAKYISQFCPQGRYCTNAIWNAADSHYRLGNTTETIQLLTDLYNTDGNPYREQTCSRLAELLYEQQNYADARRYFIDLSTLASDQQSVTAADLGVLRCSYFLNDDSMTIAVATRLLEREQIADEVRDEALYNRAKAHYRAQRWGQAVVDFTPLSKNVRVVTGAEAAYLLAECYFNLKAYDTAEQEIMHFMDQRTQHQYWLAKGLILLADINVIKGDLFQAKQYLLALQANYKEADDIQTIILQKLAEIESAEAAAEAVQTEEEDDETNQENEEEK
ncbi:MAG: tetratricopeptide repeat protein [Paludibacteraceae bacterium]|nr:tetratricopeptide repeat protein [Paludibacteraceae bacterium]